MSFEETIQQAVKAAVEGAVAAALRDVVEESRRIGEAAASGGPEIEPGRLYQSAELAPLLGLTRAAQVTGYVPEAYSQQPGGPKTARFYLGINVLRWLAELPPLDVRALAEERTRAFQREASRPATTRIRPASGRVQVA